MSAERVYRLLLRAFPRDFRAEYEREMVLLFRDQCRESDVRTIGFWAKVLADIARSAPALRAEATRTIEVFMKLAAIITVLLGVFGFISGMTEWIAGSRGAIDGRYVLVLANADGSLSVAARSQVGVKVPSLVPIGSGLLIIAGLFVLIAFLLLSHVG